MTGKERDVMTLHVATIFAVLGKKAFLPSLYLESGKIFAILRSAEASSYESYFTEVFDQSKGNKSISHATLQEFRRSEVPWGSIIALLPSIPPFTGKRATT